jgi:hypothetical protein
VVIRRTIQSGLTLVVAVATLSVASILRCQQNSAA